MTIADLVLRVAAVAAIAFAAWLCRFWWSRGGLPTSDRQGSSCARRAARLRHRGFASPASSLRRSSPGEARPAHRLKRHSGVPRRVLRKPWGW